MSQVDDLREKYEKANDAAGKLSGEYQTKYQEGVADLREKLRDRYGDRIEKANAKAKEAQERYLAYEAAAALIERGQEGASTLGNHSGRGGELLHEAYEDLKTS